MTRTPKGTSIGLVLNKFEVIEPSLSPGITSVNANEEEPSLGRRNTQRLYFCPPLYSRKLSISQ